MSAIVKKENAGPFVANLRSRPRVIDLTRKGEAAITIRVEMAEVWDTIRMEVSPKEPVLTVKRAALEALASQGERLEEFVIKFRGWEILDEGASLMDSGVVDGSIFLLADRRRRPVK